MPRSAASISTRILNLLLNRSRQSPQSPFMSVDEMAAALDVEDSNSAIYTALHRLGVDGLIAKRALSRHTTYSIKASGRATVERLSASRPWERGTLVTTRIASYRIVSKIRPLSLSAADRVEVYLADVISVSKVHPTPEKLREAPQVVIKTLPNAHVDRLAVGDPGDRSRYLQALNEAFEGERAQLEALNDSPTVAATMDWGWESIFLRRGKAASMSILFIVQEFVDGPDLGSHLAASADRNPARIASVASWFELAEALVLGLRMVHASNKLHRRISASTIYLRDGHLEKPVFVDVGEALFFAPEIPVGLSGELNRSASASPIIAATATGSNPYVAPELRHAPLRPSRIGDIYSVGAVLYYAATGHPPAFDGISDRESLKKAVEASLPDDLRNLNFGIADILSRCLRVNVQERVGDVFRLLADIRVFREPDRRRQAIDKARVFDTYRSLAESAKQDVFASLASLELERFDRHLADLQSGSIAAAGDHDELVNRLCGYLASLERDDEYVAASVPRFWFPENLGVRGRYLSMNAEIVRKGARIRRLFIFADDDQRDPICRSIVEAHLEMDRRVKELRGQNGNAHVGTLDTRFITVTAEKLAELTRDRRHAGFWIRRRSVVSVTPIYNDGRITRVNIKKETPQAAAKSMEWFGSHFENAKPLAEWGA